MFFFMVNHVNNPGEDEEKGFFWHRNEVLVDEVAVRKHALLILQLT